MRLNLLGLLTCALKTRPDAAGLHVTESAVLPLPSEPWKVMVTGLMAQVALGTFEEENPTAA